VESVSGPPRKYFVLTEEGNQAYDVLLKTWNEMTAAVNQLTQNNNDNTQAIPA
jgi:PadR family transcriptional regulator PadR